MKIFSLLLLGLFISTELHAEPIRYIRDTLHVPLRSGQSGQHRIVHKGLISGARLELLATSEDGKYSQVRTSRGLEGWLQSQYLSEKPAAKDLLKAANEKASKLEASNKAIKQQLAESEQSKKQLSQQLKELNSSQGNLSQELAKIKEISSRSIQINDDNGRLLLENETLKNQLDVIAADNQRLQDKAANDNFLNGAFAVLLGVMVTLLVPRLWPKKKTDWA